MVLGKSWTIDVQGLKGKSEAAAFLSEDHCGYAVTDRFGLQILLSLYTVSWKWNKLVYQPQSGRSL